MAILNKFCWTWSLHTGSMVIGILGIALAVIKTFTIAILFSSAKVLNMEVILNWVNHINPVISNLLSIIARNEEYSGDEQSDEETFQFYTTLIFTIVIGFFCCSLIINCLLIVGAMLKSHFFFIPFLGYKTLMIILTCVALGFESNDASNSSFTALVIQEIIEMALTIYCIVVVYSYMEELKHLHNTNYTLVRYDQVEETTSFIDKEM